MLKNELDSNSKDYKYSTIIAIVSILTIFLTSVSSAKWKERQHEGVCFPTKKKWDYPMIAYLAPTGMDDGGALYNFIFEYSSLVLDESLDGYEKTSADSNFKMDYIKARWERAIYLSKDKERTDNIERLKNSNEMYFKLNECNCNYNFNIDAIESIQPLPQSGVAYVTTLGHWQISYNHNFKTPPDKKVYGYKRVHFLVGIGVPEKTTKDQKLNEYGFYTINHWVEDVNESVVDDLFKNKMILGWDNLSAEDTDLLINKKIKKPEWGIE